MEERACATRFSAWRVGFTPAMDTATALQLTPSTKTYQNHNHTFLYCHDRHLSPRTAQAAEQVRNLSMACEKEGSQIWCCHYDLAVPENGWENTRLSRRIIKTNQNHGKNHSYPTYPEKNWWLMWLQYPLLQWFTATRSIPEVVSPHSTCRGAHPPLWREDLQRRQSSKKMGRPTEKTLAKPQKMGTVFQWKTIYIKSWLKIDMTNWFFLTICKMMIEINQKRDRNLGLKMGISSCDVMFIDRNHAGNQKNSSNPSFPPSLGCPATPAKSVGPPVGEKSLNHNGKKAPPYVWNQR